MPAPDDLSAVSKHRDDALVAFGAHRALVQHLAALVLRDTRAAAVAANVILEDGDSSWGHVLDTREGSATRARVMWPLHVLGSSLEDYFDAVGATNYVEAPLTIRGERFVILVERIGGKTPGELHHETREELEALRTRMGNLPPTQFSPADGEGVWAQIPGMPGAIGHGATERQAELRALAAAYTQLADALI